MEKFKEGSIVALNTGGPLMTVELINDDKLISTVWFVNADLHRDAFSHEQLILIRE